MTASPAIRFATILLGLTPLASCSRHHLDDYNFSNRTLALVYIEPPTPELKHGWFDLDRDDNAIRAVVRAGAAVAKEVEARRAIARLDSAVQRVNVEARLAQRTLERASRYFGTRAVSGADSADFVLEVTVESFGIDARSNHSTSLFTEAEAVLIDRRTGREIWHADVHGRDRLTPWVHGTDHVPSAVLSAVTLHTVSVNDFQEALEQLVAYTSRLITDELRGKLRGVRN